MANDMKCGQSMTPRVDALLKASWPNDWNAGKLIDLARELECDGYEFRMGALDDSKRLIDEKMELRASLAESVAALKEHLDAHEAQFPAAEEGQMAQDAWAMRKDAADKAARAIIAKHSG